MYAITPILLSPSAYQARSALPHLPRWADWPPVTLVQAPLGRGKTTWLSHELARHTAVAGRVAWVHLTPLHDVPHAFWPAVLDALQTVVPTLGTAAQTLLQSVMLVPHLSFVNLLKTEIAMQAEPLVLVLDNCEQIQREGLLRSLAFLVDEVPASLRLVLVSNETEGDNLPLNLSGVAARGELWALDDPAMWPTSFMPTGGEVSARVAALSATAQTWLANSCRWPWLTADLLTAVAETRDLSPVDELVEAQLLQPVLVNQEPGFVYPTAVVDTIAEPEPDPAWAERAVGWLTAQGYTLDACDVAIRSELWATAADLLEQAYMLPRLLARGAYDLALHWGTAVPPYVYAQRPLLTIYLAWAYLHQHSFDKSASFCERAEAATKFAVQRGIPELMTGYLATVRTILGYMTGQYSATLAYAHLALENLPHDMYDVRAYASICLADAYRLQENYPAARDAFAQVNTLFDARSDPYLVAFGHILHGRLWQEWGYLGRAKEAYEEVIAHLRHEEIVLESPLLGEAYLGLGEILYEQNELTAAYKALTYALMLLEDQPPYLAARLAAYLALARVYLALDEGEWARLTLRHVLALADTAEQKAFVARATALQALLDVQAGQVAEAEAWAASQNLGINDVLTAVNEETYLIYARVLIAQEEPFVALRLLKRLYDNAQAAGRTAGQIGALLGQAVALAAQGHPVQGVTKVSAALALGQGEGFWRIFVDAGEEIGVLLQELIADEGLEGDEIADGYAQALLNTVNAPPPIMPLGGVALPEMEADVLAYLAEPEAAETLTARADGMNLAETTLAWHEHRLCHHLGVPLVTAVVRRARELGRLPVIPEA